jgi:hypothetical protein
MIFTRLKSLSREVTNLYEIPVGSALMNYSDVFDEFDEEATECPVCRGTCMDRDELYECPECGGEGEIYPSLRS